jgi:hypothetical protein
MKEQSRTPADCKLRREGLLILERGKKRKVEVPYDDWSSNRSLVIISRNMVMILNMGLSFSPVVSVGFFSAL